jgi:hypothetical protein
VLEGADHRECRVGALVLVAAVRFQAVGAASGLEVDQGNARVVSAQEPFCGADAGIGPALFSRRVVRSCARVSHGAGLDRLLVEARARLAPTPTALSREAEGVTTRLDLDEPFRETEALGEQLRIAESQARGDSRLR